ncbi:MAG: phenylalanine--tRNA ligase beta subunit-related protein [Gemmatimonadota bacterium]
MSELEVDAHPALRARAFVTKLLAPLGELVSPDWLTALLKLDADAPVRRSEELRSAVRDMLRHGGYKPTGRGKPASEYLVRTAEEAGIRSINAVVDACNVVSLHSGFPISVVDVDCAAPAFRIAIAAAGEKYVFNAAGQEIDVSGLVCLFDTEGPVGNAVKDSQRTKTSDSTRNTLSVIWGVKAYAAQLDAAYAWYRELLERLGAITSAART